VEVNYICNASRKMR